MGKQKGHNDDFYHRYIQAEGLQVMKHNLMMRDFKDHTNSIRKHCIINELIIDLTNALQNDLAPGCRIHTNRLNMCHVCDCALCVWFCLIYDLNINIIILINVDRCVCVI